MVRGLNWLTGRGRQEKRPGERPSPDVTPPRTVADDGWRPAQTGRSLLQANEHRRLIRVLTENSPLSQQVTEAWWLRPLEEMVGRVQACPAAWSGPFSGPGGFNELSLNVATRSVRLVRGMMLPQGATPEEQAEQTPGWVCAAYWAGLFHHLPWLMQVEGALKSGRVWYPGLSVPGEPWRVRPASEPSGEMGSVYVALRLLPEAALLWLQRWPALSDALLLYLSGRRTEAGILNSIVNDALHSCGLSDAAIMSGQAPHQVSLEAVALVTDHTPPKLYETDVVPLSSHDHSPDASVPIKTGDLSYSFSQDREKTPVNTVPSAPLLVLESALSADEPLLSAENDISTGEEGEPQVSTENLLSLLDLMAEGKTPEATEATENVLPDSADNHPATPIPPDTLPSHEEGMNKEEQAGALFLEWVRDSVEDGTLSVNEKDSLLHVLVQFVFLVSPTCFYRYSSTVGDGGADKDRLQKSFEALNVHHSRNGKGLFHYHQYDTPDKSGRFTKVSGYMINADIIFKKGSCPADSIWLSAKK
ncbi:TraI domain-containing protein [Pantoea cypripedii]|uniref:TraI domain-containing protein n=1 Tax=Pantoea cypripedii TaxID=55209 RepID=UPI001AE11D94|nr:TraI domain-containing protein [Pantoea cypripedii]